MQRSRSLRLKDYGEQWNYQQRKVTDGMVFGEKLKRERNNKGWSQEELAEQLFVSRQSVSKWENGQNYPSIEIIIRLSDLFGVTIDELLRSDEELTEKVIKDSKQLAYPRVKFIFDVLFLIGAILLVIKLIVLGVNRWMWSYMAGHSCGISVH